MDGGIKLCNFHQCLFCAKCLTVQLVHIYNGKKKPDDKKEVENEK